MYSFPKKETCVLVFVLMIGTFLYSNPVDLFKEGQKFQSLGDYFSAMEKYTEAVIENPNYGSAWKALAQCSYNLDEYEMCLDYVSSAEKFMRGDPELSNLAAFSYIGLGNLDEAYSLFSTVLELYPNDPSARFGLAELDIAKGRIPSATDFYLDALKRSPENRKALLSLALVYGEMGNYDMAEEYIQKALQYHSQDPQVHFYSAWLQAKEGKLEEAEGRVRAALKIDPEYDEALELLSSLLYYSKRYSEVIPVTDKRITADRNCASAWYLKARALENLGQIEEAYEIYQSALYSLPGDQFIRTSAEMLITNNFTVEDDRRNEYAGYHFNRAKEFSSQHYLSNSIFEYRRALKLDPYDSDIRQAYAELLRTQGYNERYAGQLEFIINNGNPSVKVKDAYESYSSLLKRSLSASWGIDSVLLDKTHLSIGLYFLPGSLNGIHPDGEKLTTLFLSESMMHEGTCRIYAPDTPVNSFSEAFRDGRNNGVDYFGLVEFAESENSVKITVTLYVTRTGKIAGKFEVYRTGTDRFYSAVMRLTDSILKALPKRGVVLARSGKNVVVDLGRWDGVAVDSKFNVLGKNSVYVADEGLDFNFNEKNIKGTVTLTDLGEDISQGVFSRTGFYDTLETGDYVIPVQNEEAETGTQTGISAENQASASSLLDLLRDIAF